MHTGRYVAPGLYANLQVHSILNEVYKSSNDGPIIEFSVYSWKLVDTVNHDHFHEVALKEYPNG